MLTVVLSVMAAGQVAERRRVEEAYAAAADTSVARMATDFEHHLQQLAEDARLIAELLWQTGQDSQYPRALRERVLSNGVRALSSAVHHCRGVGFSADGIRFDVALDPNEDPALGPWLAEQGSKAASADRGAQGLLGPLRAPGDRPFFVQVQALPFGVVAAAVDARRLFETLQHGRPIDGRFVLVDGAATLWVGCGSFSTCQGIARETWNRDPALRSFMAARATLGQEDRIPDSLRRWLSLSPGAEASLHWYPLATGHEPLALGLLTPLSQLQTQRRAEWWRLLATGAGILLSAGIVGAVLWRQRQQEHSLRASLRHAEELNQLEHQLVRAEKLATVGVLTAGLAHELGTPLAIIRGRAEILAESNKWPDLETILEQSDHISNTLRQVLDFSRAQPVSVQAIDVMAACEKVGALLDFRLRQKRIGWQAEASGGPLAVAADPDQLQQVLVNLVLNAVDACGPGGRIQLHAERCEVPAGFIRLEVTDDGCGIPATMLDAVFDPFFTTKPKGEGTGLGLPVTASIVRNHGGQISIRSTEGKGTTVTLLLPKDRGFTA